MEKRRRKVKKRGGIQGLISGWVARLKSSPIAYNAVLILLVIAAIIVVWSVLMMFVTRHGTHRTVPDFMGVKIDQAELLAKENGLQVIINDSLYVSAYEGGIVLDQLPQGGAEVKSGRKIYVTINSFRQKMVKVPYVANRSLRQAKNMLEVAGLGIEKLVYEEDIATNYVLAQLVDGREMQEDSKIELEMGSGVVLKVGVEPEKSTTIVPKAIGQGLQSARSRLWEQGLNIGKVNFDEGINLLNQKDARVYRQSLSHNQSVELGSVVDLWLTLDANVVTKSSAASDKLANELEEERLKLEQARLDSIAEAEGGMLHYNPQPEEQEQSASSLDVKRALQRSSAQAEVTETDEDEFF